MSVTFVVVYTNDLLQETSSCHIVVCVMYSQQGLNKKSRVIEKTQELSLCSRDQFYSVDAVSVALLEYLDLLQ